MNNVSRIKSALEFSFIITILILGMLGTIFSVRAYPKTFATEIRLNDMEREINPEESLVVNFSEPMLPESVIGGIRIVPEMGTSYRWEDSNRKLTIMPEQSWKSETEYRLEMKEVKNIMFIGSSAEFLFRTVSYPKVKSFIPQNGEQDVLIGIEDPIKIIFNKPLNNYHVKVTIDPKEVLTYQLEEENGLLDLLPTSTFEEGKQYSINVYIKHKSEAEGDYREIYSTSFVTKIFPKNLKDMSPAERLDMMKRRTQPKVAEGKYIDINLKEQVMVIFEDGKALDAFLVSSGKRGMDTPQGNFKIFNKHPRLWSKKYSLYMPYWMAIVGSGLFGIHELPEWPSGYKEGQNHLGIPVSHGCVRLGVGPAKRVYDWAEIGIPVVIH